MCSSSCTNSCIPGSSTCCPRNCASSSCTSVGNCLGFDSAQEPAAASHCQSRYYGSSCSGQCSDNLGYLCAQNQCTVAGNCAGFANNAEPQPASHCQPRAYGASCNGRCTDALGYLCAQNQCTVRGNCAGYADNVEPQPASHCQPRAYGASCNGRCTDALGYLCAQNQCTVAGNCAGFADNIEPQPASHCQPRAYGASCNGRCTDALGYLCAQNQCTVRGNCAGYADNVEPQPASHCQPRAYGASCNGRCTDRLGYLCARNQCTVSGNCAGFADQKEPALATHCQRGASGASCNGRCGSNCRFGCSVAGNCFGWDRGGCDHCASGFYGKTCGSRYTLVSKLLHCTGVGRVLKSTVSAIGLITRTASCQSCQFVLADGRGALLESLGEQTVNAFEKVLKSPTAKLIAATKGIPIVGAAANFALADNVCERIKVVTTFGCELGAGALIVGGAASAGILSAAGLFAFAACATVGAGVEGACGEIAPKSWSMPSGDKAKHYFDFIDRKGTDNVCSVVCPAGASGGGGGQQRRREALAAMTTLAANLTWPASFVALATIDSGTGSERRVLLAQSKTRNAALALTLGANDTWSAQWQQCSDAGATMSSQVRGACGTAAPQAFCPSSLPQAILVQVVSDALARVSGARNTSTPSDFVDVGDFELERPDNATIVLGNQSFPGAMHWRARVDVNASDNPNVTETQFSVLFQQAADGRPLALSIELNLEARFVMAFWAINSAVTASQLDSALTVPSCCNSSATANSTCAASTFDLAASLVQLLDGGGKSALPLDTILPASLLAAASTSVSSSTQSPAPVSSATESLSSTIDVSQSTAAPQSTTSPSNAVTTTTEGVASSALTVVASLQLTAIVLGAVIIVAVV